MAAFARPRRRPPRSARGAAPSNPNVVSAGPYSPKALVGGNACLWSLDGAQKRLLRHSGEDPGEILESLPCPGPEPAALAFDGASLWSYDAAQALVYRHGPDGGPLHSLSIAGDVSVAAMAWVSGRLWISDSKSRKLLVFEPAGSELLLRDKHDPGVSPVGLADEGGTDGPLWLLATAAAERPPALLKCRR
jgi:hypothetical protein